MIREAAKKVPPLVVRPLSGGEVKAGPLGNILYVQEVVTHFL